MLNFHLVFNSFFFLVAFILLNNIYTFKILENSYFSNILSKLILDEFYLFNFYYIWGNFSLMFIMFLLIFYTIFSFKSSLLFHKTITILLTITIILYLNLLDYYFFNIYIFSNELFLKNYNVLLNNSVNKIHPFLLYSSLYFLISLLFISNFYYNYRHLNFNFLKYNYNLSNYLFYLSFTLLLGSWWAFQEGSWGGWWDWDISEVFGLFILVNLIKLTHNNSLISNCFSYLFCISNYTLMLLFFYLFMQLNFSLISHNFNLHTASNFISNFTYAFLILLAFIIKITLYAWNCKLYNNILITFNNNYSLNKTTVFNVFLLSSISLIILLSTFYILSNWLWSNFSISYSIGLVEFTSILNIVILFIATFYWNLEVIYMLTICVFLYDNMVTLFILMFYNSLYYNYFLHYLIFLCFILNIVYRFTELSYWNQINFGFNETFYYFYNHLKTDTPMLNSCKSTLNLDLSNSKNFNWWYDFTTLDFKIFDLYLNSVSIFQNFIHDSDFNIFMVYISSFVENQLLLSIFLIFTCFIVTKTKQVIIVF